MRSPQEIVEYVIYSASSKEKTPVRKIIVLGFLAGVYISMGALLSIIIGFGFPEASSGNPALTKLLMGVTFPIGLIITVIAGGELFTGCCSYFIPNLMAGRQRLLWVVKYCTIVWLTNFLGSLFFGYVMVYLPHLSHYEPTVDGFMSIAAAKTSNPIYVTIIKGMGANWLVCLAMWLSFSSKTVVGKVIGIWIPVMAFVAMGYEHSIANMFFLPVAMLEGFDLSIADMMLRNILPASLGNILGGALFVGGLYGYLYNQK